MVCLPKSICHVCLKLTCTFPQFLCGIAWISAQSSCDTRNAVSKHSPREAYGLLNWELVMFIIYWCLLFPSKPRAKGRIFAMADQMIAIPRNTMIQIWICLTSTWSPLILCSKALASIGHTLAARRKKYRGFANMKSWDDSKLQAWDGGEDNFSEVWERLIRHVTVHLKVCLYVDSYA